MQSLLPNLTILKIGGKTIDQPDTSFPILKAFANLQKPKILVHGGGNQTNEMLDKMGIDLQMVDGRRITDKETLKVVAMLYAGWINKSVVAQLQAFDCNALGFSGADGNLIQAHKRHVQNIDYGYAGDIDQINTNLITQLFKNDIIPVICSLTHDKKGQLLNTNADTIAAQMGIALTLNYNVTIWYCMTIPGVLEDQHDPNSLIANLNLSGYNTLKSKGIISGGMIPKLDNAFSALQKGIKKIFIGDIEHLLAGTATCIQL